MQGLAVGSRWDRAAGLPQGREPKALLGIQAAIGAAQGQAAGGQHPQAAPGLVDHRKHRLDQGARRRVAAGAHHPAIGVLHAGLARLQLAHAGQQARHQLLGRKAGDHHRHLEAGAEGLQLRQPHHRAHMARRQKALHAVGRLGQDRRHRRRHAHVGHQQREIGQAQRQGLAGQQGGGRRRGLEPHRQEHHLALGVLLGQADRLQGGGEQAHVAAAGPHAQQVVAAGAAGHPQHVAVGAEDHLGAAGQLQGRIDGGRRRHAHRAAGPVDQPQPRRQQLVQPPAHDRVGLAAAHLHQRPGAGHTGRQGRGQLSCHAPAPARAPAPPADTGPARSRPDRRSVAGPCNPAARAPSRSRAPSARC
jgi:hypothetical protein